ncbi:LacI family DNA-binding transcriptional regulator [Agrobacterium sp. NPDC090273]|uniref:LacI family DNA-binding transcriptional regulator n=1 Tax=Agrobacterium sp. NPDC090273 TaxID=3363919 RepID=UPI00383BE661
MSRHKTIDDLARESRVSVSTIDRILSGRGQVKPSTMEHVLAVAEHIGFYGVETIRNRLLGDAPERRFGFLLNSRSRLLYSELAQELTEIVRKTVAVRGHFVVSHLTDTDPDRAADALVELGKECDAIACVCIDHPVVSAAADELARRGIPVVAMISDISSPARAGFVGANDHQLGRTAGWFANRLARPGKAVVLVGSERYTCQQQAEASFRSFLRTQTTALELLNTKSTEESDETAERVTLELLKEHSGLSVLFAAGGGIDGICAGIEKSGRNDITLIGCEMTRSTRSRVTSGEIDVLLVHPVVEIAHQAVCAMIKVLTTAGPHPAFQSILPFNVVVSENC